MAAARYQLRALRPGEDGYRTPVVDDLEAAHPHDPSRFRAPPHNGTYFPSNTALSKALEAHAEPLPPGPGPTENTNSPFLTFKQRIRHFTWSFFAMNMATGGMANVIYSIPFRFPGLYIIGLIFVLVNIFSFLLNCTLITMRFRIYKGTLRDSFIHPSESLFIGSSLVSFGTILLNISQYGVDHVGDWLNSVILVLFWVYCVIAVVGSLGIYLIMWSTQTFTVSKMTPVWIFPAYPLLIVGPHAGLLTATLSQKHCLPVVIAGVALQGTGFMVSMMIYSAFIYRLMTQKLPKEALRPGMFVSVGPAAFTVSALILIGDNLERSFPADFLGDGKLAAFVLRITATFWGAWLWGLAIWFFLSSVGAHWSSFRRGHMHFVLPFWSFIFPQTALVTATIAIGKAFSCRPIQIVGTAMAVLLLIGWFIVLSLMIRAIYLRQILWPQRGEDKDEGGFKRGSI